MDKKEFKVGKLYCVKMKHSIPDTQPYVMLFDRFDNIIGEIQDGALVIYIGELEPGYFNLVSGDQVGYAYVDLEEEPAFEGLV